MAKTISRFRKRLIVGLVAVLTVAGAGIAFAYWTSIGTGAGSATTGASGTFTITSQPAVGTIAPGNAGQTVSFTVTNSTANAQYLTSVAVTMASPTGTPWAPTGGCLIADYTAVISVAPTAGDIAPGGSVTGTAKVTLANTAANQDACQGQQVPLRIVAS
jgi:hypothetical protein